MPKQTHIIKLASLDSCTGCAACASVCPKGAISMVEDREGFLQPRIDTTLCVECHKCEQTCPIVSPIDIPQDFETKAYAAINKDEEIRMQSSSGGVFYALAKWVIEQGGVVFGAKWDEKWEVKHDYAEDLDGVKAFMRSKYVQSRVGETYKQAKKFLQQDRWVLYVGTPCQIAGLHRYIGKQYNNHLLTISLLCHGVPSVGIWKKYLNEKIKQQNIAQIKQIAFRNKLSGWSHSHFCLIYLNKNGEEHIVQETCTQNTYFSGFNNGVFLRNSCYQCQFRSLYLDTDLIIGDCWNVWETCPELFDDKGISTVVVCSKLGEKVWNNIAKNFLVKEESVAFIENRIRQQQNITQQQGKSQIHLVSSRLHTLLAEMGVETDTSKQRIVLENVDWNSVEQHLAALRKVSLNYLKTNLEKLYV